MAEPFLETLNTTKPFQVLLEGASNAPVGIGILNRELRYTWMNRTLVDVFEIQEGDYVGKKPSQILPQLGASLEPLLAHVLNDKIPVLTQDLSEELVEYSDFKKCWSLFYFPLQIPRRSQSPSKAICVIAVETTNIKHENIELRYFRDSIQDVISKQKLMADQHDDEGVMAWLESLCQFANADRVSLYQDIEYSENQPRARKQYEWFDEGNSFFRAIDDVNLIYEGSLSKWKVQLGKGEQITEKTERLTPQERQSLDPRHMIASVLLTPLFIDSMFWGFLKFDYLNGKDTWNLLELEILSALIPVLSLVLRHQHYEASYKKLIDKERQLEASADRGRRLNLMTERIRKSLDPQQVLATAVGEIQDAFRADRVLIYLSEDLYPPKLVAESSRPTWKLDLDRHFHETWGCLDLLADEKRESVTVDNIYTSDLSLSSRSWLVRLRVQSLLICKIKMTHHWGILVVEQCSYPRSWTQEDEDLLQAVSRQIETAYQQSHLFQQSQNLNSDLEKEIQLRTESLRRLLDFESVLKRITDKVRDSLDESQILQTVVKELALNLPIMLCDTGIYDQEHTTTTICYEYGNKSLSSALGIVIPNLAGDEIYQQIRKGGGVQFCPVWPSHNRQAQFQTAILRYPIRDDRGILGELNLYKPRGEVFDDLEIRLTEQVANQCAIAIRQARLYCASQAQVSELQRLNQLKDDFLHTVSHELRSPITSMRMSIQMMELMFSNVSLLDFKPEKAKQYLEILKDQCNREVSLINDLLDLSKLDVQEPSLTIKFIDFRQWISGVIAPFIERMQQSNQQLVLDIPQDLPMLPTDESFLERIFRELINNACKYTPNDNTIAIKATSNERALSITVLNTGAEILPEDLPHIFDRFYRGQAGIQQVKPGTGLGLALIKKLVDCLNGMITVESTKDITRFTLVFPLYLSDLSQPST